MRLKLIELKFGYCGGSALAHVYGPERASIFDSRPYLAVHISFTLHRDRPDSDRTSQDLLVLPIDAVTPFLCIGFLSDPPMHTDRDLSWPHPSEYRTKLAHAIAKMVTAALQIDGADHSGEAHADTVAL
jgi:hypothetical protein